MSGGVRGVIIEWGWIVVIEESMVEKSKKYVKKLEEVYKSKSWDVEVAHAEADKVLCELLEKLGYGEVVEAWKKIPKWYA